MPSSTSPTPSHAPLPPVPPAAPPPSPVSFTSLHSLLSHSPPPSSVPPSRLSSLIASQWSSLLRPLSSFSPSSSASSSAPAALHSDWRPLLSAFSAQSDVSMDAAALLLSLHLRSSPSSPVPSLAALRSFLRLERCAALGCVVALFHLRLDPSHTYHDVAVEWIRRWQREDGERLLVTALRAHCLHDWGEEAEWRLREQLLMMQSLFLLHYDAGDAEGGAREAGTQSMAERVVALLGLCADTRLLTAQGSLLRLTEEGRRLVQRLSLLSLLLLLELLQLGKLRLISDHPLFACQAEDARERWLALRGEEKEREEARREVEGRSAEVVEELDSLPFADPALMQRLDAALTAPSSPLGHPLLLFAWAVFLSLLSDCREELEAVQSLYQLPLTSPPAALLERPALVARLQLALSGAASPLSLALSFLRSLPALPSPLYPDEVDGCVSGYKEIVHELLTSFCASSLYPLLSAQQQGGVWLPQPQLVDTFCRVMEGDNDLCYRWWEAQQLGDAEQPLLQHCQQWLPHSLALIRCLTALVGRRGERRERLREDGLSEEVRDEAVDRAIRDAAVCASQVFRSVLRLQSYATAELPPSHISASPSAEAAALAPWTLRSLRSFHTSDGVLVPAGSFGRPLSDGVVQWRVDWSGWRGLLHRLDRLVVRLRGAEERRSESWAEVHCIAGLVAAVVSSHPPLYRELQLHLRQQRESAVDVAALMCRLLQLLSSSPPSALGAGEELQVGLVSSVSAVLTAAADADLVDFTRALTATFASTAVDPSTAPPPLPSSATVPSAAVASLVQSWQALHFGVERACGRYPLTLCLLHLVHSWLPHYHLALLHLQRPVQSAVFPVAVASASSASTFAVFAGLDAPALLRFVVRDVFGACDGWRFAEERERAQVKAAALRVFLVALGHALSRAAERLSSAEAGRPPALRPALFDLFAREAALQRPLLSPLVEGSRAVERSGDAGQRTDVGRLEPLLLHCLYTTLQLLRMEKEARRRSPQSAQFSLHSALLTPLPSPHGRAGPQPSGDSCQPSPFASEAPQAQSAVEAAVRLLAPPFSADVQSAALELLSEVAAPVQGWPVPLFPALSKASSRRQRSALSSDSRPTPLLSPLLCALLSPRAAVRRCWRR